MTQPSRSSLTDALLDNAALFPAKNYAVIHLGDSRVAITYADLLGSASRFARAYADAGVRSGDIVFIFAGVEENMFAAFFGAVLIGAAPSYMPPPSPKQDPAHYWADHHSLVQRVCPRVVISDGATAAQIRASSVAALTTVLDYESVPSAVAEVDVVRPGPDDVAFLQHSSGTTGRKKGVVVTHGALRRQVDAYSTVIASSAADVVVSWLPVYHDMGLVACTLMPLMLGQTVIVLDPFVWSSRPVSLFHAIAEHRGTLVWLPNFAFEHLVRTVPSDGEAFDLSGVRASSTARNPARR